MTIHYYIEPITGAPLKVIYHTKKPPHLSKNFKLPTVREWDGEKWIMPCFPEIAKSKLASMVYIGYLK